MSDEHFSDAARGDSDEDAALGRLRTSLMALMLAHPLAVNLTPVTPTPRDAIVAPAPPRPSSPRRPPDMRQSQTTSVANEEERRRRERASRQGARVPPSQRFADYAASLDDDAAAEAMAGAVIPAVVGRHPLLGPLAPALVRASAAATQELRRAARTRPSLRALPEVVRRTASSVVRQGRAGGTTSPAQAVDLFRRHLEALLRRSRGATTPSRAAQRPGDASA